MSLSFEEMLKEAHARQKANDRANQELLNKKKYSEVEQKKKLIEQHKMISGRKDERRPAESKNHKPAQLTDLLSSYKIPKRKIEDEEGSGSITHQREQKNGISHHSVSQSKPVSRPLQTSASSGLRSLSTSSKTSSTSTQRPSSHRPASSSQNSSFSSQRPASSQHSSSSHDKTTGNDILDILSGAKHATKTSLPVKSTTSKSNPSSFSSKQLQSKPMTAKLSATNGPTTHLNERNSSSKILEIKKPPSQKLPQSKTAPVKPLTKSNSSKPLQTGPSTHLNGRNGFSNLSRTSTVRKVPTASFEEMMRLATTNLNKPDGPNVQNPPPPKPKLPRDPPPSVKDLKKAQSAASKISTQKDAKKLNNYGNSSKVSDLKKPPLQKPLQSKSFSTTKPTFNKPVSSDRSKPAISGMQRNPERFRNDNRNLHPPVKRPNSIPAERERFNPLARDRFTSSSRDRYNPSPYDRYSIPAKRSRYEEEEDDYDDDSMDDFIVDDDAEDVEKELKNVLRQYCRSDERIWEKREREIDLRQMNARFHEIDAEEKRSTRIARLEDMIEEHRGSQALG